MAEAVNDVPLTVNAQYIKDLSFELPDPLKSFADTTEVPSIEVGVNVSIDTKAERTHEVTLHISVQASRESDKLFILEMEYAGLFTLGAQVPTEAVNPILLIECPRLLFPFARALVSTITREAGFPALTLNPIDFVDLYRRQVMENDPNAATKA